MRELLAGLALLTLVVAGCGGSDEYLVGGELYERSCAACHATDGSGGIGPEIDAGSNTHLNLSDDQIVGVIAVGPGNMPGFSRLSDEQVASLVLFVRELAE